MQLELKASGLYLLPRCLSARFLLAHVSLLSQEFPGVEVLRTLRGLKTELFSSVAPSRQQQQQQCPKK